MAFNFKITERDTNFDWMLKSLNTSLNYYWYGAIEEKVRPFFSFSFLTFSTYFKSFGELILAREVDSCLFFCKINQIEKTRFPGSISDMDLYQNQKKKQRKKKS